MKRAAKGLSFGIVVVVLYFLAIGSGHAFVLYVSDQGYGGMGVGTIKEFDESGNGSVIASGLNQPWGLAFDVGGNLYEADKSTHTIMKYDRSGNGSPFVGTGTGLPIGLAFDVSGNLYVSAWSGRPLSRFSPKGDQVSYWGMGSYRNRLVLPLTAVAIFTWRMLGIRRL